MRYWAVVGLCLSRGSSCAEAAASMTCAEVYRESPAPCFRNDCRLTFIGAVARIEGASGPEYALTEAGKELAALVGALGTWGQRWLPRSAKNEDNDLEPLLVGMH